MKSWSSLRFGCEGVAWYSFILAAETVFTSANKITGHSDGTVDDLWLPITDLILAFVLFFGATRLFKGLTENSKPLLMTWFVIFLVRFLFYIGIFLFLIFRPHTEESTIAANFATAVAHLHECGSQTAESTLSVGKLVILIVYLVVRLVVDIVCLATVYSYQRNGMNREIKNPVLQNQKRVGSSYLMVNEA